jgi:hypothetical protein
MPQMTPQNLPQHAKDQLRYSVYLEELAEALYETAALLEKLGDRPPDWNHLPQSRKSRYRTAAGTMLALVTGDQS